MTTPDAIRMTLAEAQAIECNQCGDCCDTRRVARTVGDRHGWAWGADDGAIAGGLIIPLYEAHPGTYERAIWTRPGDRIGPFRCTAFVDEGDTGRCTAHDGERPKLCGEFPVFGARGEWIAEQVARLGEYALPIGPHLWRCAWANVVIVAQKADDALAT